MSKYSLVADLDERDVQVVADRMSAYLENNGPQVGDFVKFADGIERRISYVWAFEGEDPAKFSVQTSDGGSFYLGKGYCSFSGGLHTGVPASTLKLTGTIRRGSCWIFHHDHHTAGNGIDLSLPLFNEWACSLEATR
jgi:hypothetical protein